MAKDNSVNLRLDEELKSKIADAADNAKTSVSNFLRHIIEQYFARQEKKNAR